MREGAIEMAKVCCVCNEPKESKDNIIFACKGQGCDVSVHQGECNVLKVFKDLQVAVTIPVKF